MYTVLPGLLKQTKNLKFVGRENGQMADGQSLSNR